MFDFGWQEFMVIAFVLVLVVGPKDLPRVLRAFTSFRRKLEVCHLNSRRASGKCRMTMN